MTDQMNTQENQPHAQSDPPAKEPHQKVTPWEVEGNIDYLKLVRDFGSDLISPALVERIGRVTKRPVHHWLRRNVFFSHRAVDELLDAYEAGKPFYLYTGRGPSSESLHFGHMLPFIFTKYLQDAFQVPLVVQMTDDEKFLWKNISLEEATQYTRDNAKDIIAMGFDIHKTFIFSNVDYVGTMYPNILRIEKATTTSTVKNTFGFKDEDNIGKMSFPAIQAAPSFSSSFPHIFDRPDIHCLIPCAIDQDPYFRMTRDVAPRLGFLKPSLIHSRFFPALQGYDTKMSASKPETAIFLTDTPELIREKIMKHALSGGQKTKEEQERLGANVEVDIPCTYLGFFMEDDARLKEIKDLYRAGKMQSSEVKGILADLMIKLVLRHQEARRAVTDDVIDAFLSKRKLKF